MAAIGNVAGQNLLTWLLTGSTPTQPGTHAVNLANGAPSSTSGSEIPAGSGITRQTATFNSPAAGVMSVTNQNAMTYGPVSAGATISGLQVWDNSTIGAGNILMFGTVQTVRTMLTGDSFVFASGAITCSLS